MPQINKEKTEKMSTCNPWLGNTRMSTIYAQKSPRTLLVVNLNESQIVRYDAAVELSEDQTGSDQILYE